MRFFVIISCGVLMCAFTSIAHAAKWQVDRVNHVLLTPPEGLTVDQMSGVTYLGLVDGSHRFVAAMETRSELLAFDVAFDLTGSITAIANIAPIPISPLEVGEDFEGIAYTNPARNSVFLSDEDLLSAGDRLGVREVSLATGAELQAVTIPTVFGNRRANRGFESLTRTPDGSVMWTANEQALTVDGDTSTASAGTDVRLLKLSAVGDGYTAGPQYAYQIEPIHGTSAFGQPQSGLSELVGMPDGTVLALERSVAVVFTGPVFLNRIYEVGFAEATDVSVAPYATGLSGQTFDRVGKELLWSGAADATTGQNLEGLTLGPRLANGDWILLGVVDDEANDSLSMNTIVAFTASANPSADFDDDGDIDGADFLSWQQGVGATLGATHTQGDTDRDGDVDDADLNLWKSGYSPTSASEAASAAIPEPAVAAMILPLAGSALTGATCGSRPRRQRAASTAAAARRQSG
jgi:hypothetical protein